MSNVLITLPKEIILKMLTFIPLRERMVLKKQNIVIREICDAETRLFFQRINEVRRKKQ